MFEFSDAEPMPYLTDDQMRERVREMLNTAKVNTDFSQLVGSLTCADTGGVNELDFEQVDLGQETAQPEPETRREIAQSIIANLRRFSAVNDPYQRRRPPQEQ